MSESWARVVHPFGQHGLGLGSEMVDANDEAREAREAWKFCGKCSIRSNSGVFAIVGAQVLSIISVLAVKG